MTYPFLQNGLVLIALGSKKTNVKEIVTNYKTWIFGALQIFRNMFMLVAFGSMAKAAFPKIFSSETV